MSLDGRLVGTDSEEYKKYEDIVHAALAAWFDEGIDTNEFFIGKTDGQGYFEQIGQYSALQLLRTYAAHVAAHGRPPDESNKFIIGPELNQMYNGERPYEPFTHLIDHSDADGWYLPQNFSTPLALEATRPDSDTTLRIDIGSSPALLRELDELNRFLKMPGDYGELGGSDELAAVTRDDEFGAEKRVWGMMRWLARESVRQNLLFEFC